MRLLSAIFLALALSGCISASQQSHLDEIAPRVGQHFWPTSRSWHVCKEPAQCYGYLERQGFVVLRGIASVSDYATYAEIRLDDGRTGFLRVYDPSHEWSTTDPDAPLRATLHRLEAGRAELAKYKEKYCTGGPLVIGMDQIEATRAWCIPDHVNSTETRTGTREQWVYPDQRYLYFENGKLVAIQR